MGNLLQFVLLAVLVNCALGVEFKWWQKANFYQIYPRSFMDSDGDGIGDLEGIRQKLPYLKELGIDATWLSPIFKSPMADFGYDISDFYSIQPEYGSMQDFERLAADCKRLGIKLILDFVPNHSSDEHEFFKKSVANDAHYKNYYVWHKGRVLEDGTVVAPSNWISVFRGSAWEWHPVRKEYYLHQFVKKQPDLNYREPLVVEEMKNVLRFWLAKGVNGFRIDAVPYLFEFMNADGSFSDEEKSGETDDLDNHEYLIHTKTMDHDSTFDMIYQWREVLEKFKTDNPGTDDLVLMTEAYTSVPNIIRLYGSDTKEGAQIPFNFEVISNLKDTSTGKDFKTYVDSWMTAMPASRTANWVLGNHDQKRLASRLGVARADLYNIALNTLPGIAVTYNGEELGLTDVYIPWSQTVDPAACNSNSKIFLMYSRDPARTPFQWDDTTSGGFSVNPKTWLPMALDYKTNNYVKQKAAAKSHLKIFQALLRLRKERTLREAPFETMILSGDNLVTYRRHLAGVSTIVVILNFNKTKVTVDLTKLYASTAIPNEFVVITSSLQTDYIDGTLLDSNSIYLPAESAIVLEGISTA